MKGRMEFLNCFPNSFSDQPVGIFVYSLFHPFSERIISLIIFNEWIHSSQFFHLFRFLRISILKHFFFLQIFCIIINKSNLVEFLLIQLLLKNYWDLVERSKTSKIINQFITLNLFSSFVEESINGWKMFCNYEIELTFLFKLSAGQHWPSKIKEPTSEI